MVFYLNDATMLLVAPTSDVIGSTESVNYETRNRESSPHHRFNPSSHEKSLVYKINPLGAKVTVNE